jgi:hypothetical protein
VQFDANGARVRAFLLFARLVVRATFNRHRPYANGCNWVRAGLGENHALYWPFANG